MREDQRKFDGRYFTSHAPVLLPVHEVIWGGVPLAVSVMTQLPGNEPVALVVSVITEGEPATVSDATYCVVSVEQPAVSSSAGYATFVAVYSEMDVLQAAMAATPSDIFDRIT